MHWKVDIHSGGANQICSNTQAILQMLWVRAWNSWFLGQQYPNDFSRACSNPDGDRATMVPGAAGTEEGIYWRYCVSPTCHSELAGLDNGAAGMEFTFAGSTEPDPATLSAWVPGLLCGLWGTSSSCLVALHAHLTWCLCLPVVVLA